MFGILFKLISKKARGFLSLKGLAIVALIAFSLGAGSSVYIVNKFNAAARLHATEKALEQQKEAVARAIKQSEAMRELDFEIIGSLNEAEDGIDEAHNQFSTEIIKYVEVPGKCDLSGGAVRLLNNLIDSGDGVQGVQAPANADEESAKAAPVSQFDQTTHHGQCIKRYNELMAEHNNLIDWINQFNTLNETAK